MVTKTLPDAATIRKLLDYDPETGVLTWRPRAEEEFTDGKRSKAWIAGVWNRKHAGRAAGTSDHTGRSRVKLGGILYCANRVVWVHVHGCEPVGDIDHKNGDAGDDRICNLRDCNRAQNIQNGKRRSSNTSGYKGVHWHKIMRKWRAEIRFGEKRRILGWFDTPEQAHEAYCGVAKEFYGEFFNDGHN